MVREDRLIVMFTAAKARARRVLETDERGSVLVLYGILGPAMILLIFAAVQMAIVGHANNLLTAAAEIGVEESRGLQGGSGAAAANQFLATSGATGLVQNINVNTSTGAEGTKVVVRGKVTSLIPGVKNIAVERQARGPVERWTD